MSEDLQSLDLYAPVISILLKSHLSNVLGVTPFLPEVATLGTFGILVHFRHLLLTFPVKRPWYHDSKIQKKGSDDHAGGH